MTPLDRKQRIQKIVDSAQFGTAQLTLSIEKLCDDVARDASAERAEAVNEVIAVAGDFRREIEGNLKKLGPSN